MILFHRFRAIFCICSINKHFCPNKKDTVVGYYPSLLFSVCNAFLNCQQKLKSGEQDLFDLGVCDLNVKCGFCSISFDTMTGLEDHIARQEQIESLDRQTDRQSKRKMDRQTDRQTNTQIKRQTCGLLKVLNICIQKKISFLVHTQSVKRKRA